MKFKIFIFIFLIFLNGCIANTGNAVLEIEKLEGPFLVVNVVDGDTLDLANGDRLRFSGINTPETGECYYQEAKDKLGELTLRRNVLLEKDRTDIDKYERKLRYVYINESSELILINGILVEKGYARVYDKYKSDTKRYEQLKKLERNAIENKLGVWSCIDNKENCLFVGSANSEKYHTPDCKFAKKIKPENLVCFETFEEAESEGREFSGC
ncbi:thermonuclease family protein [Candidatus Woesearchaeota archaeon]|nr:thermonuclease family protein [Candidatus Woesearchaeota archaeon]